MSTTLIIILAWLVFDFVVYCTMWFEHHHTLTHLLNDFKKFMAEMNEEE